MKKNFTRIALAFFTGFISMNAMAATGWFSDYIKLNVNGNGVSAPTGWYWIGTDPSYATQFDAANLGTVTSLILDGADMKYWSDTQDRTGSSFFYRIMSADGLTEIVSPVETVMTQTGPTGNDYQATSSELNVNLLSSALQPGTSYRLQFFAKSWGSGQGDSWLSNSGANYTATFTTPAVLVSGSASQDGFYTTLGAAISAIGTSQTGRNIEIKIGGSTTELTSGIFIGAGDWSSLKIYPTAISTIQAGLPNTSTSAFITLSAANNVTIDGRLNQTGAGSLTIINSCTDNANARSTILFDNDAKNNVLKYCTVKGSQTGNYGIISFSATAATTNGNGLNTIDHNLITNNGTIPKYGIYAIGNTSFPNIGNQITNNEFKDLLAIYIASTTVYIAGGTSAPQNDNFTISGNSFYNSVIIDDYASSNLAKIMLGIGTSTATYGGSHTITDNFFGGSSANCNGTLQKRYKDATLNIIAIYPSGGTTSIQNNTIKNISWSNDYYPANMTAINIAGGTGDVNIGTVTGNTIGDNTSTGSIVLIAKGNSNSSATMITLSTTGTVNCRNNKIGSITGIHQTANYTMGITAISKTATAGTTNISNNTIGSTNVSNSIYAYYSNAGVESATTASQNVSGISCAGTGICSVSYNTIANLTNFTTIGYLYSININSTSGTANGNLMHSNVIKGYTGTGAVIGINSNGGNNTITNNVIKLGDNTACEIRGINDGSSATSTSSYHNTIYIGGSPVTGAFPSYCEFSSGPATKKYYKNNIFVNARSNNGATGSHYALYLNSTNTGTLEIDGNDYFVTGTGSVLCRYSTDKTTLSAFQTATGQDASSVNTDPGFANPGGLTAESYVPSSLLLTGVNASVTTDYSGVSRTTTPAMGAHDFRIWNGSAWNSVPGADYNAKIDGTFSGAGFSCRNLVLNAGKQLSITSGTMAVGNNFTILSDDANGTGTFTNSGSLTVGGVTTVQQYITSSQTGVNGRNWYISSPLTAALSSTITGATGNGLVYYDGTTNWPAAGTTMEVMKGYIAKSPAQNTTISFAGGTLNDGNQSVADLPVGFNLVGNPYPSYVDFTQATKTNVANSIWYRSKSTGAYVFQTYNVPGNIGANDGSAIIPPMQSFWIKTTGATNTFGFTNAMRSHQDQSIAANRLKAPGTSQQKLVRLQLSNPSGSDETVVYFNPAAQNSSDEFDTQKMFNSVIAQPEVYSKTGTDKLVINGLNEVVDNLEIPLGYNTATAGSFTFKVPELGNFDSNTKIYLLDKQENIRTELSSVTEYTFNSDVTTANENRFSLLFKVSNVTTATDNQQNLNTKVLVNESNQLVIIAPAKSTYSVYNAAGQLFTAGVTTSDRTCTGTVYIKGVYVVKITEIGNELTTRVIIK